MGKEDKKETEKNEVASSGSSSPIKSDISRSSTASQLSIDSDLGLSVCRVCQCVESDKRGDTVLGFLRINPPLMEPRNDNNNNKQSEPNYKITSKDAEGSASVGPPRNSGPGSVRFVSPTGEVFVCDADIETGECLYQDRLIELGCACKDDLALVHYACGLKWFVNHGSVMCEICGVVPRNIRIEDFNKVLSAIKENEALIYRTVNGMPNPTQVLDNSGVDPDAVAAIWRQRLTEISLWFVPHSSSTTVNVANPLVVAEQPSNVAAEDVMVTPRENTAIMWVVEGTGIVLATCLLTVTVAWLITPYVGKKTAKIGLHILLGGVCALAVVVFFRFIVLTRIRYRPARYWAVLFVCWFLVFAIWASRTRDSRTR